MPEGQPVCVKRLAPDVLHIRVIQIVADQREPDVFHVDADLVGAAGLQDKGYEAVAAAFFHDVIMGHCPFSMFEIDLPFDKGAAGSADRRVYGAGRGSNGAPHDSQIFSFDFVTRGHGGQNTGTDHMLCDDGQTGSVPVKAVRTPEDKWLSLLLVIVHQCIGKGVPVII